jgi:hypothetical protein
MPLDGAQQLAKYTNPRYRNNYSPGQAPFHEWPCYPTTIYASMHEQIIPQDD